MFYLLSYGIGHGFKFIPDNITLKASLHGVVSGLLSPARGGNFKSGYMSAFFSKLSGGIDVGEDDWVQGAFQTLVGGTASEIGGGKFANGAVSAAVVYLFNDSAGSTYPKKGDIFKKFTGFCTNGKSSFNKENYSHSPNYIGSGVKDTPDGNYYLSAGGRTDGQFIYYDVPIGPDNYLDEAGLGFSILAAGMSGPPALVMGGIALVIDACQPDLGGVVTGSTSMILPSKVTTSIDIVYGAWQVIF